MCADETAAVEWFEAQRWPDGCACISCGVSLSAEVVTDELNVYPGATEGFAGHRTTNHAQYEFARVDADGFNVNSNTAESSHALLKRGLVGVWHRMSQKRLPYYLATPISSGTPAASQTGTACLRWFVRWKGSA
ncbi:MAG TPA: transposase [Longimicrobium sp.]|nr:transposase [Longimicrobium sp.]